MHLDGNRGIFNATYFISYVKFYYFGGFLYSSKNYSNVNVGFNIDDTPDDKYVSYEFISSIYLFDKSNFI